MTNTEPAHTHRKARPLATLAMAALIGSGCLAIAVEASADPGGGGDQAAKYSECMRANGVADFPDPNVEGQIAYGGISVPKDAWVSAVDACKNLEPADWSDAGRTPEQQDAAVKLAQCMRDNGVPDFPDPATPRDPLIDTSKMRGDVSARDIPELKGAQEACRDFFEAALPPLGTGRPG
jgi:hypothetical protein